MHNGKRKRHPRHRRGKLRHSKVQPGKRHRNSNANLHLCSRRKGCQLYGNKRLLQRYSTILMR